MENAAPLHTDHLHQVFYENSLNMISAKKKKPLKSCSHI